MEREAFGKRVAQLRMNKGVSARDMSLSLGQSPGYINNVENGVNLPSMTVFFYICDYFHITPKDFFDTSIPNPCKTSELTAATKGLSDEQLDHLIALAKGLVRNA
ncbi:MAG: helix-turn-helix transcriptional regulator [Lachnospiraceae bacterium]|nr:helix-turn-helix transcriptional regulator [Lachnospiraceae bacterium]